MRSLLGAAAARAPRRYAAHVRDQARHNPHAGRRRPARIAEVTDDRDEIVRARCLRSPCSWAAWLEPLRHQASAPTASGVAILQVDTDRRLGTIDRNIYGQFLEEINHSAVDGLFAEQIRGAGFEGTDFATYWTPFGPPDAVRVVEVPFERGTKSVRITAGGQPAGIRQRRVFLESGRTYDGSVWIKIESGAPRMSLRVLGEGRKRAGGSFHSRRADRRGRKCRSRSRAREPIATRPSRSPPPDAARRSSTSCR